MGPPPLYPRAALAQMQASYRPAQARKTSLKTSTMGRLEKVRRGKLLIAIGLWTNLGLMYTGSIYKPFGDPLFSLHPVFAGLVLTLSVASILLGILGWVIPDSVGLQEESR